MTPFHIENHNFKLSILELFFVIIFGYILYLIYFFYTNQIKANGKNNFTTFQICSNFRKSPTYNYMLGFDRTLYKASMNCKETIMHTLEHIRSFSDNNNYFTYFIKYWK